MVGVGGQVVLEQRLVVVALEEQGQRLKEEKKKKKERNRSICFPKYISILRVFQHLEAFDLPVGTTMGGGLGAMMWGAVGGMGTTLSRGAGIMGGI